MNKKGQGISMNVIIIAAIALIVMIVLIAIFTGRIGTFQQEAESGEQAARSRICATAERVCVVGGTTANPCVKKVGEEETNYGTLVTEPAGGWIDCTGACCEG